MARAMWKGVIQFADERVPVKLYAAVRDTGVHFRMLHAEDQVPVKQQMVNPVTGDEVPYDRIRKGYQLDEGVFVILTPEELEELTPEASRGIEVVQFIEPDELDHQWYDRPYYLGPDGNDAAYAALAEALAAENKEAVVRWVMRKKAYIGALRSDGEHLMLITLRRAEQVVSIDQLETPAAAKIDRKELDLAERLIEALVEDELDLSQFGNEYRDRVLELIEAKRQGAEIELPRPVEKKPAAESLADSLRASLKAAKERSVA